MSCFATCEITHSGSEEEVCAALFERQKSLPS